MFKKKEAKEYLILIVLALVQGIFCGLIGGLFSKTIAFVTDFRADNSWILYGILIAGVITVFIFKYMKTEKDNTDIVIKSVNSGRFVSVFLLPSVFIGTVLTHLCGGSAGREGAALQMGGASAGIFTKVFKLKTEQQKDLTIFGMAGFFAALFGTPFGAAIFALEVTRLYKKAFKLVLPTIVSSLTAFGIALLLQVSAEHFSVGEIKTFELLSTLKILIIAVLMAVFGVVFCGCLKFSKYIFKRWLKNPYLRICVGAVAILILTRIIGNTDYNGGGINIIERIFSNNTVKYEAFALKLLLTLITVAAGFKGGEIVPTFFMGATLGATLASLLGLSLPIGAAVGMTALFCAVTKCPLASFILAVEMFGFVGFIVYLVVSFIAYFVSGSYNLYDIEKISFKKYFTF